MFVVDISEGKGTDRKKCEKLCHDGYQYYFHSQYPTIGPKVTLYYRCIHRKTCQGKVVIKDDVIKVKEHHSCEEKEKATNVVVDATKRMADQVRTIATAEPTKPAVQIANEVMEAAVEEYQGKSFIIYLDKFGHIETVCIYIWKKLDIM